MGILRAFGKSFALRAVLALQVIGWPGLGWCWVPLLDGATFGSAPTRTLSRTIGETAVVSVRSMIEVGGVAFVRPASGQDGWEVVSLQYDGNAPDGQRLLVGLAQGNDTPVVTRPRLYDWEFVPIARFVIGDGDSAFTYFGQYDDPRSSSGSNFRPVGFNSAFKDTLLGLRLMQLDLMMFRPEFTGYFKQPDGHILLGGGERAAFDSNANLEDNAYIQRLSRENYVNQYRVGLYLAEDCQSNPSVQCLEAQPYASYIVGDLMSPVLFFVQDQNLAFRDPAVCWQLWREADPDESTGSRVSIQSGRGDLGDGKGERDLRIATLSALSASLCQQVRWNFNGIQPLAYRSGVRTMRYAALFRHFKGIDPQDYDTFVASLSGINPAPQVETPTEVGR